MLTRIRIEVTGEDSAAATEAALSKYEHALQVTEAQRHGIGYVVEPGDERSPEFAKDGWKQPVAERDFYNQQLGREVTDEVIEYDPSLPGYKGRRVVCFKRLDTRNPTPPALLGGEPTEGASVSAVTLTKAPSGAIVSA
jgi:hypothetical protein